MNTAKVIAPFYSNETQYLEAEKKLYHELVTSNEEANESPLDDVIKRVEKRAKFPI